MRAWLSTVDNASRRVPGAEAGAPWRAAHLCGRKRIAKRGAPAKHDALTTGTNTWAAGLDVVVEGRVDRITDDDELRTLADRWLDKYGEQWRFEVRDGSFDGGGGPAGVFRIEADKLLAFAKAPHAQTTFRLGAG